VRELRDEQVRNGSEKVRLAYGQLMGMADNVSCELVQASKEGAVAADKDTPRAYKVSLEPPNH